MSDIVFFTNKSTHGVRILNDLNKSGIFPDLILVEQSKKPKSSATRIIEAFRAGDLIKAIKLFLLTPFQKSKAGQHLSYYRDKAKSVSSVNNFNGPEVEQLLSRLDIRFIILGGSRILKPHVLKHAKEGVLNAHPGLLPYYRGAGVIFWSLYNNNLPGVTVHYVNSGIDTGNIIRTETLQILKDDTIEKIRVRAEALCAQLMCEVVKTLLSDSSQIALKPNPSHLGKTYYLKELTDEIRSKAEENLQRLIELTH